MGGNECTTTQSYVLVNLKLKHNEQFNTDYNRNIVENGGSFRKNLSLISPRIIVFNAHSRGHISCFFCHHNQTRSSSSIFSIAFHTCYKLSWITFCCECTSSSTHTRNGFPSFISISTIHTSAPKCLENFVMSFGGNISEGGTIFMWENFIQYIL